MQPHVILFLCRAGQVISVVDPHGGGAFSNHDLHRCLLPRSARSMNSWGTGKFDAEIALCDFSRQRIWHPGRAAM